jgi:chromosome segregation ATPase
LVNLLEARVWLNNSEEAKKMEEEHMKSIKLIQDECKSKVATLEIQVEELKEKISLGSSNASQLSELLADSEKSSQKLESDLMRTLAELEAQKKTNAELKKELNLVAEGMSRSECCSSC